MALAAHASVTGDHPKQEASLAFWGTIQNDLGDTKFAPIGRPWNTERAFKDLHQCGTAHLQNIHACPCFSVATRPKAEPFLDDHLQPLNELGFVQPHVEANRVPAGTPVANEKP